MNLFNTTSRHGIIPIYFKALGTITNPELMNMDTGEVFRLLKTMSAGEEIRVHTHFAGKRVVQITGGAESNAFSFGIIHLWTIIQMKPAK